MMQFEPGDFIVGFWILAQAGLRDVLFFARRPAKEWRWEVQWRFRYYEDDKAFDSKDKKSFYGATLDGSTPVEKVLEFVEDAIGVLTLTGFGDTLSAYPILSDDPEKLHAALKECPMFHMREMTLEEAEAEGYQAEVEEVRRRQCDSR